MSWKENKEKYRRKKSVSNVNKIRGGAAANSNKLENVH